MGYFRSISASLMVLLSTTAVLAEDWTVDRVRGSVSFTLGSDWVTLERGQSISDGAKVRTEANGRLELVRGAERISLASNTEIAIRDAGAEKMTSVVQWRGSVTVDAERRNVQHFSVQTPVLAAVVKGTQFTVTYTNGQASVSVERGVVQVQDGGHDMMVDVGSGQTAMASQSRPLDISGPGAAEAVFLIEGEVVPAPAREAVLSGAIAPSDALEAVQNGTLNVDGEGTSAVNGDDGRGSNGTAQGGNSGNGSSGNRDGNHGGNGNHGGGGNANSGNGNSGNNGNGNSAGGNSSNGNGNSGNNGSGNGNNGNGNSGNGNGNGNGNDGNGNNGNSGNNGNGNNGNGNGNGNNGNGNGNGNGNDGNGNSGNNGNGNGNGNRNGNGRG